MKKRTISLLVAALLPASVAANPVDNFGANAIRSSDYALAEARLNDHLRRAPADQPALLNLAYIYRQTARATQANMLYNRVLNRADVQLLTAQGAPKSSHALARAGLSEAPSLSMR